MAARLRNSLFPLLIYLAFFASGAASLVAEVTWNRMLIVVVGNSLNAAALIIMIFMGGLGLGSWVGGRVIAGRRISLVPYLLLEISIGLYVLASPSLFEGLTGLFTSLAGSMDNREGLTLVRMFVTALALLLPAFLMGATFPAMISGAALDSPTRRSARTGYLYSTNTLGAAIGCFAAGYYLLLELGVQFTLNVAFFSYLVAACSALLANFLREPVEDAPAIATDKSASIDIGMRRFLYVATFAIGFVSLAYEVLLTRVSILYLGNTVSVFPLVLTAFLLGTGISAVAGTWLFGFLLKKKANAHRIFGISAAVAALLLMVTPYLLLTDFVIGSDQFAKFADSTPESPLPILGILALPVIFIGALLPLAIRMLQPEGRGKATREAATLYSLNTAGGLVGAGVANHYLVPAIGMQGTLAVLTGFLLVIAAVNLTDLRTGVRRLLPTGAVAIILALLAAFALPDMTRMYAGKIASSTKAERVDIKLVTEGRAATVTVLDQFDPKLQDYRDMYLNGVEEASTRFWHVQLFKLLGILPPLIHSSDGPKDAMVIAFGAGITAGSVLASDEVASLDVVDLNPDIEGINDLFTEVNGDVFHKDRFHFHNDDGRNYLVTANKQYDLIIGDSTHPRAYDSWILYTTEFYEAAKARLKPNGIFAQWVPVLGSMRGELMRIHLNTFRSVFPTATVWYIYGSDQAFLLATPEPLLIDAEKLQTKIDKLPGWFKAEEYQMDTVARVAGFYWMSPETINRMIAGETRTNTDDTHYFDKQSAIWPLPPQWQMPAFQTAAQPFFTGLKQQQSLDIAHEQEVAGYLGRYAFHMLRSDLHAAWCADPENGNAKFFMAEAYRGQLPSSHSTFCAEIEITKFQAAVAQRPNDPMTLNGLADALTSAGRLAEARSVAEQAVALAPNNGMVLDTLGWILYKQGEYDGAYTALTSSLEKLPSHPIVLFHLGIVAQAQGQNETARKHLEMALRVGGNFPYAEDARVALELLPE
jgi:spermidine synthase